MAKKIKITRKELLKEPDQFLSSTDKAMLFFRQNRSFVIGGAVGVMLFSMSFFGYQNYQKSRTMKFESLYFKMETIAEESEEKGKKLHHQFFELNQSVFYDTNPIPIKYMMKRMGLLPNNEHRLPMSPATPELEKRLEEVLLRAKLI